MFQNKFSHVNADETKYFTAFEKFASIENSILKSVQKLDKFPTHILKQIETETRLQRSIQNRYCKRVRERAVGKSETSGI